MLKGKVVVLGVTGSIAAYKIAGLASALKKLDTEVHALMTQNAVHFISPVTFETLTGNKCLIDTFDRNFEYSVEHVALAKRADVVLVAPATANVIAKLAHGLADDMLTTTVLACTCKKLVSPAMNTNMYRNPAVQDNLRRLRELDFEVIEPDAGYLACGDTGEGKMPSEGDLLEYLLREIAFPKDLAGTRVLVTAGATRERLDPVRFLSNHSTGKMGYALARHCMQRGARVTLISGAAQIPPPPFVDFIPVTDAQEMLEAVRERAEAQDIIIKAAAVADYTPVSCSRQKLKKQDRALTLELKRTPDILAFLGENRRPGQLLCGFSMETKRLEENSRAKLERKNLDMVVANNLLEPGAGFGCDTNVVTVITREGDARLPQMSKHEVAKEVVDRILALRAASESHDAVLKEEDTI
ncbi:MAG: bifunctional phosphopantothenoylcysteine decarboxylase/phosphopantothenate--cysteine ligase CoaBC [Oscillospiraceae bacterium]|jgi:phosphopantothenoylcysteine decarboxylase/phosphopantothenate--cysteine ligase|nr:bifunctional phosphopantothenoylcysteine decarboxylase/phosphopantothenate--cysteine ligase CoaBC [Oscillospiraceae bacterium]